MKRSALFTPWAQPWTHRLPVAGPSSSSAAPSAIVPLLTAGCLVVGLAAWPSGASAMPSARFQIDTYSKLNKGKPQGTLISSSGEVVSGLGNRKLSAPKALMYWSKALGDDGTVYLGSGQPGKILAVHGDKIREIADLKTILVSALTIGPRGKLLAATLPEARILEVDPKNGKWRELGRLKKGHIWDLLYDAKRGKIFIAAGAPGKVYVMAAGGGKADVYYDAGEEHLLCLAQDAAGNLLTGGTTKAILYRITQKGQASAIHDFAANELRRIRVAPDGTIYAAVNLFPAKTGGNPRYDRPKKGKGGTPINAKRTKGVTKYRAAELRPGAKAGKGSVFRIDKDGRVRQLLGLSRGYFTDLALAKDGTLWAGEGTKGKVFLLRKDTKLTAFDLDERQVLLIALSDKGYVLGTGDGGAIYRVLKAPKDRPAYLSQVLDAKTVARWGNASVRATAKLKLLSRSGNTAKPDGTWSAWKAAKAQPNKRERILSPRARYLQLKTTWPGGKASLRAIEAFYRPLNLPPRITTLEVKRKASGKNKPRSTEIQISWKIKNPDKDPLVYRLYFREALGAGWRPMNRGEPTDKLVFNWDTQNVAEDTYRIKVVASDERGNGIATALTHTKVSEPIVVDNRKPHAVGLKIRAQFGAVSGMVKDSHSPIASIEFSVDGQHWQMLDAADGVYDSNVESFRFTLPKLKRRGAQTLLLRITDAAGNVGLEKRRFVR